MWEYTFQSVLSLNVTNLYTNFLYFTQSFIWSDAICITNFNSPAQSYAWISISTTPNNSLKSFQRRFCFYVFDLWSLNSWMFGDIFDYIDVNMIPQYKAIQPWKKRMIWIYWDLILISLHGFLQDSGAVYIVYTDTKRY